MRRLVLAVTLVAFGCQSKPNLTAEAAEAVTFLNSYAQILCNYTECADALSPAAVQQACSPLPQASLDQASNIYRAVLYGGTTFSPSQAKACLEALAAFNTTSCWGASAPAPTINTVFEQRCGGVFAGAGAPGSTCYDSSECLNGYCDASLDQCPGHCNVARASDSACQDDSQCRLGLVCYNSPNNPGGSFCVAPSAIDASCLEAPCQDGLVCAAGTCVTPAVGMTCSPNGCGNNLSCHVDPTTNVGTCAALAAAGAACVQSSDCEGNQLCLQSTDFNSPSVCGSPSDVGTPCGGNTGTTVECFQDLVCDPTSNQCASLPPPGMPCIEGRCNSAAYCDQTSTCIALKALGDACQSSEQCAVACSGAPTGVCVGSVAVDSDCVQP